MSKTPAKSATKTLIREPRQEDFGKLTMINALTLDPIDAARVHVERDHGLSRRSIMARFARAEWIARHAYQIRYHGYLFHGHIKPDQSELWSDGFDHAIHAPSIVVYDGGQPAATVRLCSYDPDGPRSVTQALPSADLFALTPERLARQVGASKKPVKIIEVSKMAKLPEYESDFLITMALFKMLKLAVSVLCAEIVIVAVRVQHMKLYRRLGFDIAEAPRLFTKDNVVLGLMACRAAQFRAIEDRAEIIFKGSGSLKVETNSIAEQLFQGKAVEVFSELPNPTRLARISHTSLGP